jgi:PAS domain S-box-containing protein
MYEDNPSMFFTVDAEGTVLSVNRFGAQQLGYSADELVGRSVLDVFYEADRNEVRDQLARCVASLDQVADWEFRKVRKDGSLMWVKEVARAVPGPTGGTIVLIVCEDISERKRAEEAREELESKVEVQMASGNVYGLTFRELTVLNLVAEGRSDKDISTLLGIELRTASKHVENILAKMAASSRTEAGVRAVREGLLQVEGQDT